MNSRGNENAFSKPIIEEPARARKKPVKRRRRSPSCASDDDDATYEESEGASLSSGSRDGKDAEVSAAKHANANSLMFLPVSKKSRTLLEDESVSIHVVALHPTWPNTVLLVVCAGGPITLPLTKASSQSDIRWSTTHPATGLAYISGAFVVCCDLQSTAQVAISELDAKKMLKSMNLPAQLFTPLPGTKPISPSSDVVVLRERAYAADFINDLCLVVSIPCCESLGFIHLAQDSRFVSRSPQVYRLPRGVVPLDVQCCLICNDSPNDSSGNHQGTALKAHAIVSSVEHGVFVFSVTCDAGRAHVVPRLTIPPPSMLTSAVVSRVRLFRLANRGIAEGGIPELINKIFFWTDLCIACASIYWDSLIVMHCASKQVMLVGGLKDISPNVLASCGDTVLAGGPAGCCEEVAVYGLPISGSFAFDRSLAFRNRLYTTLTVSSNILSYRNKAGIRRDIFAFADIAGSVSVVQRTTSKVGDWKVIGDLKLNAKPPESTTEKYSGWIATMPVGLFLFWADNEDLCGAEERDDATADVGCLTVMYASGTVAEWHFKVRAFSTRKSHEVKKT